MSDCRRQFRTIFNRLKALYPFEPQGHSVRHLTTLAALVSGIVSSRRTNLPDIAGKVPDGTQEGSRVKRFSRWINNERVELERYYLPFALDVLEALAHRPLHLVMDVSAVGRGCATLMLSLVYQNRALPLSWIVVRGSKGHFPEELHLLLLDQIYPLIPEEAEVVFLGDGEFDGILLQETIDTVYGWKYVCRTAKNIWLYQEEDSFTFDQIDVSPGECRSFPQVRFTQEEYGPVHAIAWWEKGYQDPIYLVTNVANPTQACRHYRKRFSIETFFSDQKSRGFHLHKSHLSDPERLSRLMMAACLAYLWIIYLGVVAIQGGWLAQIHRTDRCDLSLFQLGLRLLNPFLNEEEPIPVVFCVPEWDE